jgi:ribosome-associated heat shock protein Hsp15
MVIVKNFAQRPPPAHGFRVPPETTDVRIDKWLWAARVFKTRALALEACRAGHVRLCDHTVKPGRPVHVGEIFVVRTSGPVRTLRVVGISDRRVGPKLLATLIEDLTPPEELERARLSVVQQIFAREKGTGRPTKRDRRAIDRWLP